MHVYGYGYALEFSDLVLQFQSKGELEGGHNPSMYTHIVTVSDAGTSSLCMCVYMAVNCVINTWGAFICQTWLTSSCFKSVSDTHTFSKVHIESSYLCSIMS